MTLSRRSLLKAGLAGIAATAVAGCNNGAASRGTGEVIYWLWDSAQLPMYAEAAKAFHEQNPQYTVTIEQYGWNDYWSKLVTGFISGTAPDVFTSHSAKYPLFADKGQVLPIDDFVAQDGVDLGIYQQGLADRWVGADGKRYGLPKDWDTEAYFYNSAFTEAAGISTEQLNSMTWNPQDGGTFEEIVRRLTVDAKGRRGDQPGFDKETVKVHGLGFADGGGNDGQTSWSWYAASNGWKYSEGEPWGTRFFYGDPKFTETIAWWRGLITKGYMPTLAQAKSGVDVTATFGAGKYGITPNGSWMMGAYSGLGKVKTKLARLPEGPNGKRMSMMNGLADTIWAGTTRQEAAWAWVKFLGSKQAQDIVAKAGVVFPAVKECMPAATAAFKADGWDITPFLEPVAAGATFAYPASPNAADLTAIMSPAMDSVMAFETDPADLVEANDEVNQVLAAAS
ncbi:carbohydrate ABC transporter substrate-binding protein (CUT1 family) [Kribbella amoyensis]|uniref:Carbohydrate ABC transporter substrate-binding protein (CUT1 family) n=1 Tax=Kribbella amoyensis TaxID=996641 RepID=A0A561BTT9_9ACTN|nr:extracellular solute-binding protein [Kribbella amoyensis]TWD82304.1 carbohydrate ABC transporter substrate-binding protein (CUT1 family) [Kribbella amoyensis]